MDSAQNFDSSSFHLRVVSAISWVAGGWRLEAGGSAVQGVGGSQLRRLKGPQDASEIHVKTCAGGESIVRFLLTRSHTILRMDLFVA